VRSRHSGTLYDWEFEESLLAKSVEDARHELRLDAPVTAPSVADRLAFAAWAIAGAGLWMIPVGLAALAVAAVRELIH
jgi:hypothetical protein